MAKQRMIVSDMWEDDFFTGLTIFERLLWVGIITSCADDQGRLQDNAALIRSKVFPLDDIATTEIEAGLARFFTARKIERYIANGKRLIQIVNWWKHQTPRWAGKSNYPPPDGWVDRERYHGAGNEIITRNWDSIGGYIEGYIDTNTTNDIKGDVKGDVKGEGDEEATAADPFSALQRTAESAGIILTGETDIQAVNELLKMGATVEDMQAGIAWKVANNGQKAIRYFSQIVGPTKTALAKRLQEGRKPVDNFHPSEVY